MSDELTLYRAVSEARRLHDDEGLPLPAAAAQAADDHGLHALHVSQHAARAIEACRTARRETGQ